MARERRLAILFADVCGSTRLYDSIGDARAQDTIARCLRLMSEATDRNRGRVVKTIGDEVMATFDSVDAAVQAGAEMQEAITEQLVVDGNDIQIRVGFHFGNAIIDDGDVFGDAVNVAARMAGQAKPGQILTTAESVAELGPLWEDSVRQIDRAALRGKKEEVDVYEIIWKRDDVTRMVTASWNTTPTVHKSKLVLEYRGRTLEVSEDRPSVVLGRADQNDLVVKHNLISRLHARIEFRKGNFLLTDQSINGTYVRAADGQQRFIRRDSAPVTGRGIIGLGQPLEPDSEDAIRFTYVE
ncbi:MAG TPA: adenylate/guanylate cyclase domain-containing protein [Gammaproteobacteria bacterium]|nr:adenylate/guanylate cyclase domain-containing protein [Gammaproteobacteria bacterium]